MPKHRILRKMDMCFALTGRVMDMEGKKAKIDFDGIHREANAEFVNVAKGDKVLVFNGFVIEKL